jgi:transcription termination factor Rho
MHLNDLKSKKIGELPQIARDLNIENASGLRKQELSFSILQAYVDKNENVVRRRGPRVLSEGSGSCGPRTPIIFRPRATFTFPLADKEVRS